jgi:hypothetical protein
MIQRKTKIQIITIFSLSLFGLGGMMIQAFRIGEQSDSSVTEYYSGKKPTISFPNPFQKTISKSINVTTSISPTWIDSVAESCYKTSISKAQLDNLLSNGVKVITMSPWGESRWGGESYLTCNGYTYVLEGPENLLNKP